MYAWLHWLSYKPFGVGPQLTTAYAESDYRDAKADASRHYKQQS